MLPSINVIGSHKMNKAVIYTRFSSREKAKSDSSLSTEAQIAVCNEYAKSNNLIVVDVYKDEGVSGTKILRPALQQMFTDLEVSKLSFDTLLVQDTDRFARDTFVHESIKQFLGKQGVAVTFVKQNFDNSATGNFTEKMMANINEFYAKQIGEKTARVKNQKAKLGWTPHSRLPHGYICINNPNPTSNLEKKITGIDKRTAPIIKEAFKMYAQGERLDSIRSFLHLHGVTTFKGKPISNCGLLRMFSNPFYIGKFRWGGKLRQGKHKPLVSLRLFNQAQERYNGVVKNGFTTKNKFLLRCMAYCEDCENVLTYDRKERPAGVYEYYFCSNCRPKKYVNVKIINSQVEAMIESLKLKQNHIQYINERLGEYIDKRKGEDKVHLANLRKEKTRYESAYMKLVDDLVLNESVGQEMFCLKRKEYENKIMQIDGLIEKYERFSRSTNLDDLNALVSNIGKLYNESNVRKQRQFLQIFFKKFIVSFKDKSLKECQFVDNPSIKLLFEQSYVTAHHCNKIEQIHTSLIEYPINIPRELITNR